MSLPDIELSVVLPAYEEADNLDRLLPQLHAALGGLGMVYEILVIDTPEERDATREVCARHAASYIPRKGGGLYGHAVRTGIERAAGSFVIFMDADGSHNPGFLPKLWERREAADLVIASRYVAGGGTENPLILIAMSLAVNVVFRVVLGLKCADVSNSLRLYRGAQLKKLKLECNHFDIVEEILVKLAFSRPRFVLKEVPFTFEKRQAGKTKRKLVAFAVGYINTLVRLYKIKRAAARQARDLA
jgi:dolichol-phosphate mannosyltransferase